jgi:two-component system cell cycle sensor histidine kinase/response regulator CckA
MGGKETLARLHEMDPNAKAVLSSGYLDDPMMVHFMEHGFRARIGKPYSANELEDVLKRIIEEG